MLYRNGKSFLKNTYEHFFLIDFNTTKKITRNNNRIGVNKKKEFAGSVTNDLLKLPTYFIWNST